MRVGLLLLPVLVLAGCTSSHGGHVGGAALLFGVKNGANETMEVGWTVASANGTIVGTRAEVLDPGEPVERIQPINTTGEHTILLSWGAGHGASLLFDTGVCRDITHLVVTVAGDGTFSETTRECHD